MAPTRPSDDVPDRAQRRLARAILTPGWISKLTFGARVLMAGTAYLILTIGILAAILLHVRAGSLAAAEKMTASLARLAADQTAHALQSVDQTLTIVDALLSRRREAGTLEQATVGNDLRGLLRDWPFLLAIWVIDPQGRISYHSSDQNVGVDLSERPYFGHHLHHEGNHLHVAEPVKSRISGDWLLPVTKSWIDADGKLLGVVVAAVNPLHFDRVWKSEEAGKDASISLLRSDGTLLMRSPFVESVTGTRLGSTPWSIERGEIGSGGVYRTISPIDGIDRLFGVRALPFDQSLILVVGMSVREILASWWHIVAIVSLGWMLGAAGLAVLTCWLIREVSARQVMEARYRPLFDANPDPMAVFDRETLRYLAVNDAMVRQYGWSREEFLTMTPADIRLEQDMPMLMAALQTPSPPGSSHSLRGRHKRKDGSVLEVEVRMAEIEFEGRRAMLPMARDVTKRNQSEQAQRLAEEQLHQLQKMDAIGQLTGGVAHDFNNILMVIMGNAEALEDEYELEKGAREHVNNISRQTLRAADLTHQLLVFSRKQPLKPQVTDLSDLVANTGRLLRRTLGEQVDIELKLEGHVHMVNVDRTQVETALVNLCLNGRDAMPGGGTLLIETRNVTFEDLILPRNADPGFRNYVMLAVTDTGVGIKAEDLDKVFEPFFTTKEMGRGTGLGLSMVYGFIKQSNGHVRIESERGHGTTVKLFLPKIDAAGPAEASMPVTPVPQGTERILVVEDEPDVRKSVVLQLQSLGYAVSQAGDGAAGIAACEAAEIPYDLLLTDVIMPGHVGGKDLADEVGRRWPTTVVVFMSGYTEDAITCNGRLGPGVRLLNKPFHKRELAHMIRDALNRRGQDDARVRESGSVRPAK